MTSPEPSYAWADPRTDARLSVKFRTIQEANEHAVSDAVLMRCDAGEWSVVPEGPHTASLGRTLPADWLLEIHRMLFPERYPRELQPDHIYWDGIEDEDDAPECFEWTSETIEWVATMLERALENDPRARLKP